MKFRLGRDPKKSPAVLAITSLTDALVSRHHAANILHDVADHVSFGSYPDGVSIEELGEAIKRSLMNCNTHDNPLWELNRYLS